MYYSYEAQFDAQVFFTVLGVVYLIWSLSLIGIFKKAGIPVWKAFVPVYNNVLVHNLAFGPEKWALFLITFVPFVGDFYGLYVVYSMSRAFGSSTGLSVVHALFPTITNFVVGLSGTRKYEGPVRHFLE